MIGVIMGRSTHRHTDTPTYRSWVHMRERCLNPKHVHYDLYGGRGITICERWSDFANFLADMNERPVGKTLDRYPDPNGNYEPSNCRWATPKEQIAGRRPIRNGLCIHGHPLDIVTKKRDTEDAAFATELLRTDGIIASRPTSVMPANK
jgi:hypothetical protein